MSSNCNSLKADKLGLTCYCKFETIPVAIPYQYTSLARWPTVWWMSKQAAKMCHTITEQCWFQWHCPDNDAKADWLKDAVTSKTMSVHHKLLHQYLAQSVPPSMLWHRPTGLMANPAQFMMPSESRVHFLHLPTLSAPSIPLATLEITTITKLVAYTAVKTQNAQSKSSHTLPCMSPSLLFSVAFAMPHGQGHGHWSPLLYPWQVRQQQIVSVSQG